MWWNRECVNWHGDTERHRIVYIEYYDRRPHAVITEEHWDHSKEPWFDPDEHKPTGTCSASWDFEWCKRDGQLYYEKAGGGGDLGRIVLYGLSPSSPPAQIWAADDAAFYRTEGRLVDNSYREIRIRSEAVLRRLGYVRIARPLLFSGGYKGRSRNPFNVGEELCDDRLAYCRVCEDHARTQDPCEHLEWCDLCCSMVYIATHVREDEPDGKPIIHEEDMADVE
jgi:hypothetical protein